MSSTPPALLGNSGAPRWYAGPDHSFEEYLERLVGLGATSAEIVLHHGPYDERTARVHVIDPDWQSTVSAYQEQGIAVQLHVSLDVRFATSRWREDRDGLRSEFEPIWALMVTIAERQRRIALVLHGASDSYCSRDENESSTVGLLDWLASQIDRETLPAYAALELGAAKPGRPTAAARSRESTMRIVNHVGSERVGICWDIAHDQENAATEDSWTPEPDERFLRRVVHVHVHDLGGDGLAHYPLVIGNVPFENQLGALAALGQLPAITMEVRWLCATRLGDPWEMLRRSYQKVGEALNRIGARVTAP